MDDSGGDGPVGRAVTGLAGETDSTGGIGEGDDVGSSLGGSHQDVLGRVSVVEGDQGFADSSSGQVHTTCRVSLELGGSGGVASNHQIILDVAGRDYSRSDRPIKKSVTV